MNKETKTCKNCTNKYICPTYNKIGACMGWGDRGAFIGLIKLNFGLYIPTKIIDDQFEFIKHLQEETK